MIRQLLTDRMDKCKTALIDNNKEVTYNELIYKAKKVQSLLREVAQDKVAILLPNGSDYIAAFWGAVEIGITVCPLNVLMTGHEIAPLLKCANITAVITTSINRRLFEMPGFNTLPIKIIYMEDIDKAQLMDESVMTYDDAVNAGDTMVMLSTSGTTGKYKLVRLSEKNIEASVLGYLDKLNTNETESNDTCYTLCAPFSSVYGIMILSACLKKSFPLVIINQPFTLDAFYSAVEEHRITHYEGGSSTILMMEKFSGKPVKNDISSLTYFGFGGSKISGSIIKNLQDRYTDKEFFQGYGMTEASPLITKHPQSKVTKVESVGTAICGIKLAIEADGEITGTPYVSGEIVVKGATVMLGYYESDRETRRVIRNGYLHTGDIGYLDEEGYLYICGRIKNIINTRGFKVYPEEVEESIRNSMLVKDCVVYGQLDTVGNEIVCVDIVPINAQVRAYAIKKYCSEHLAEYKQPKKIVFCESIEKTMSGKTKR